MKTLLTILCLLAATCAQAAAVLLKWDPNTEPDVAGYRLLSGRESGTWTATNIVSGRTNATATASLMPWKTHFVVVAYDDNGTASEPSNEVVWTNKPAPPRNLKLTAQIQASGNLAGPWVNLASVPLDIERTNVTRFYRTQLTAMEVP